MYRHGLELRSKITSRGFLELFLQEAPVPEPAADEIVIRVEAAPLHPSDIILLLGRPTPPSFGPLGQPKDPGRWRSLRRSTSRDCKRGSMWRCRSAGSRQTTALVVIEGT